MAKEDIKSQLITEELPELVTLEVDILIAPDLIANNFPSMKHPAAKSTAPLFEIKLPLIFAFAPIAIAPSAIQKTFEEVGDWKEHERLDWVKTLWAINAEKKGCTFKAIANSKIC